MKFLAEVSKPQYQANLPFHITYGPTTKEAYEVTTAPKELLEALPSHPKNVSKMLAVSLDWYAKIEKELKNVYGIVERIKWHHKQNTRAKARMFF